MRYNLPILIFLISSIVTGSCKKNNNIDVWFPGVATVREITNKPAVIKVAATTNSIYITEQGSIDSKLIPCNIPKEFIQNNLLVTNDGLAEKGTA